jgi:hypothetical protein
VSDLRDLRVRIEERRARAHLLRIGSPAPTWRWQPRRRAGRLGRGIAYLAATGCTVAGAALALSPTTTSVSLTASTYRIGATTLRATAVGEYVGDAALVVAPAAGGVVRSAADATNGGRAESGVCFLSPAQRQERCVFALGATSLSAVDTWVGAAWSRRYDDGQQLTIPANTMAPVPFAVGR